MAGGQKHYGFFKFLVDAVLTVCTGGLWLIWIFVREMRKR
jgi:ABC-type enterobactin transport system permease subunit